jgi:hypothetical protein
VAVSIELWRTGIASLAKWACGYDKGRGKLDPVYVEVTEGRDKKGGWASYSSCADLGHFLANRSSDSVNGPWKPVVNVSCLGTPSEPVTTHYLPEPGDIWIMSNHPWPTGNDYHVCVYVGANAAKHGEHITANYGAGGMSNSEFPGAKLASHMLATDGAGLIYGAKRVSRVITVSNLVARSTAAPDFSGPDYDADFTGEVQDALEAVNGAA